MLFYISFTTYIIHLKGLVVYFRIFRFEIKSFKILQIVTIFVIANYLFTSKAPGYIEIYIFNKKQELNIKYWTRYLRKKNIHTNINNFYFKLYILDLRQLWKNIL